MFSFLISQTTQEARSNNAAGKSFWYLPAV